MRTFLLLPKIRVHNANAMSSPYTIGFPAMTAWLGAVHALQRKLKTHAELNYIDFKGVAVSCHDCDVQTYKGKRDFVHSIIGTANPLDKDGSRPAFIEEARCHLSVSLMIECDSIDGDDTQTLTDSIDQYVLSMKMAGGDVLSMQPAERITIDEDSPTDVTRLRNKLMLGNVLIERRDLMIQSMSEGRDALNALLDHIKVMHRSTQDDNDNVTWRMQRKAPGWLVPIAVGFQGISELGQAANQRDADTPHRFAESVVTLGEFVMPYRVKEIDDMLWQYHVNSDQNLYVCSTSVTPNFN